MGVWPHGAQTKLCRELGAALQLCHHCLGTERWKGLWDWGECCEMEMGMGGGETARGSPRTWAGVVWPNRGPRSPLALTAPRQVER